MPFCPLCGVCYPRIDKHVCELPKVGLVEQITKEAPEKRFKKGLNVTKDADGASEVPEVQEAPVRLSEDERDD